MSGRASAARVASFALAVALLGVVLLVLLLPAPRDESGASVFSTEPAGRRALFLLLGELGFDASSWARAPGHLPRDGSTLYLPATPEEAPAYGRAPEDGEAEDAGRVRSSRRLRDPLHYRHFVEEGGTLVTATSDGRRRFLEDDLGIEELTQLEVKRKKTDAPRVAILRSGERLRVDVSKWAYFGSLDVVSPFDTLVADDAGRPLALELELGRGRIVLLAGDEFLDNDVIELADNAVLAVRLYEALGGDAPVLFDEYSLGGWTPETPLDLAFAPGSVGFTVHLLALVALALWMAAWVGAFPRDPEPLGHLSPLSRARSLAGLLADAQRWNTLGGMLQRGVLRRLSPGRAEPAPREEADSDGRATADLDRLLRPLAAEIDLPAARDLFGRTPTSATELEELATGLDRLERTIGRAASNPSAPVSTTG